MDAKDARMIANALDRNSKALERVAKAQEHANLIAIDIERERRDANIPPVQ